MNEKPNRSWLRLTGPVALMAVYLLGAMVGKERSLLHGSVALVWPPASIALAAILLFGYRVWPGVALGVALFSWMSGLPLGFSLLGTVLGNTMGAIIGAFLLKRSLAFDHRMERTQDVVAYVGLACFLGTSVNAAFSVVGQVYAGQVPWSDLFTVLVQSWVPNALATLLVAPFLLVWTGPPSWRWNFKLAAEAALCATGLLFGTLISFHSWFFYGIQNYPFAYLPFPFLVWSALRFGPRGATASTLLVSALATQSLLQRRGPFVTTTERDSLMLMGCYIGVAAVTNLLLAAATAERRQAQRATAESERRLRAVVEDQTDLICRFTPDATLTFVNGAYCRFYGKTREELLGTNFLHYLGEEDRRIPLSYLNALPREEPVVAFDCRVPTAPGQVLWQQCTVRRLFAETGDQFEFQAVIQDITQRKRSEQELRASEEKHRLLVAHLPGAVWTATAEGKLLYISERASELLGYPPGELCFQTGTLWLERIHPDDQAAVWQAYRQLFQAGCPLDVEYRLQRKDGRWIWLQNRAQFTRRHEGRLCADGLLADISRRKQLEFEAEAHLLGWVLPWYPAKSPAPRPAERPKPSRPQVLLVAEDSRRERLVARALRQVGYDIVVLSQPEQLAQFLTTDNPAAVVFDEQFVHLCSAEKLRELHAQIPPHIPAALFAFDTDNNLGFRAFSGERFTPAPTRSRLADALRSAKS